MTEIVAVLGALGGLITMGLMFYREVRKRAGLEKDIAEHGQMQAEHAQLLSEHYELLKVLEQYEQYTDALEQKVVDELDPDDLVDVFNRVLIADETEGDPDTN